MTKLIPQDIQTFLVELGTFRADIPSAFEEYARTVAALLWEKYVIFEDASIQILPGVSSRLRASSKRFDS